MTDNRVVLPSIDRGGIKLGSCLFGIPITLHYSFFVLLGVETAFSIFRNKIAWTFFVILLYGPILLITIIIHELGHSLVTLKLGGRVGGIVLWPLGGFALCGPTDKGANGDFLVAIAGPLMHIPQSLVWFVLYLATFNGLSNFTMNLTLKEIESTQGFFSSLCEQAIFMNIVLFCFNLLIPAYPLDGGRCLASLLIMGGAGLESAAYTTSIASMVIGFLLLSYGVLSVIFGNFGGILLIFISIFILFEGKRLYDLTKSGKVKEHPIFGRACYDDRESTNNTNDDATVATANDEPQVEVV